MRRSILILALCSLFFVPTFAQEAFYIDRNDSDFNGFFYDEVQEMRYSKLALDSVEHEQYVTYEVVLADTTYRIPLASIDSIIFQQPEIRFNPRVKWMEQEGLCQYVVYAGNNQVGFASNIPEDMIPQAGDVLIGLPSDSVAKKIYTDGSFAIKVIDCNRFDNGTVAVTGLAVDQLSDVFDQFITVEEIGTDTLGNVLYRRIAGCTPDGFPRKIKTAEGESQLNLIDFEGTLTRQWQPSDDSSVELTAEVGVVLTFRAIYNISWSRFFVRLEQDLVVKTKPSIGLSVSKGFEFDTGELLPVGEIMFPATCPMFAINPLPSFFLRGEGKLETRLNMPQVRIGIGQHYVMDSRTFFPITLGLHFVPDENETPTSEMLDLSAQATLSGYVQAGIKFHGDIFTASWMKKIFRVYIGTLLYVGPKVSGEYKVSMDMWQMEGAYLYETLTNSQLNIALLSLDLEAKGNASLFGKEAEKKFFDKNWSFLTDTIRFAPRMKGLKAEVYDDEVEFILTTHPDKLINVCWGELAISKNGVELQRVGHFNFSSKDTLFTYSMSTEGMKSETYGAHLILHCGSYPEMDLRDNRLCSTGFVPAYKMTMDRDFVQFGGNSNLEQVINFTTNCAPKNIHATTWNIPWLSARIDTVDAEAGQYRAVFTAEENHTLFDRTLGESVRPCILLTAGFSDYFYYYLDAFQEAPSLTNVKMSITGQFNDNNGDGYSFLFPESTVTATRSGINGVNISGTYTNTYTSSDGYTNSEKVTVSFHVERDSCTDEADCMRKITHGYLNQTHSDAYTNSRTTKITTVTFDNQKTGYIGEEEYYIGVNSGTYDFTDTSNTYPDMHISASNIQNPSSQIRIFIFVNPPAE